MTTRWVAATCPGLPPPRGGTGTRRERGARWGGEGCAPPWARKWSWRGKLGLGAHPETPRLESLLSPSLFNDAPPFGTCFSPETIRPAAAWGAPDGIPQGTPGSPAGSGTEIKFYLIIVSVTARDRAGTAKIASFYGNQESGGIVSLERAPSPSVPSPVTPQVRDRGRTGGVLGTKRM